MLLLLPSLAWLLVSCDQANQQAGRSLEEPTIREQDKPNIVFMVADNLGYGDLGCYGGSAATPNIDRLASEGIRLTQFLIEPDATASHAATMTGRYAVRSGLSLDETVGSLADNETTLAEILGQAGYSSNYLGKWYLGIRSRPQHHGFDRFYGILDWYGVARSYDKGHIGSNYGKASGYVLSGGIGASASYIREYSHLGNEIDAEIADRAALYIEEEALKKSPFFLFISWASPGMLRSSTEAFEGKSGNGYHGDLLMELDHNTGRVLEAIQAAGIDENTIVIWTGGTAPLSFGDVFGNVSTEPYRGELGSAREGAVRVPAMIKWPGKIMPKVGDGMFSTMDLFPTLSAFVGDGAKYDHPIDGIDQSAWLLGQKQRSDRQSLITFMLGKPVAVRWRHFSCYAWDYVQGELDEGRRGRAPKLPNGDPFIYDMKADPGEQSYVRSAPDASLHYKRAIKAYYSSLIAHPNTSAASRMANP